MFLVVSGAIGTSIETVFGSPVRFTCPEGQVFATGVEVIDTVCMPGGKWSQSYIPKCQEVWNFKLMNTFHSVFFSRHLCLNYIFFRLYLDREK